MRHPLRRAATLTAAALTAAACSAGADSAAPEHTDVLRYAAVGAAATASNDPHGGLGNESDAMRFALVYDVLTVAGPDGRTAPRLAASWEPDESLTHWRVALREDARFTDGSAVDSGDVLFSLRRMADKAAENYGRMAMFDLGASRAVDEHTLELVTRAPFARVPEALQSATFVVPEGTTDFSSAPPGSGPYRIAGGDPAAVALERNDDWWGEPAPTGRVEISAIADPQARADAVLSGRADVAGSVSPTAAEQARGAGVQVVRRPGVTAYPVVMRTDRAPFDDPRVREAVKLAADRQQLLDTVFLGFGEIGNDLITPADPSSPDLPQRERDLDRARALLAEAGRGDGLSVELVTTTAYPGMDASATLLAQQLGEIGIDVSVRVEPQETYWTSVYAQSDFYVSYLGGIGFLDVSRIALRADSPTNETAWRRADWERDLDTALADPDPASSDRALGELQTRLRDEGGYLVWGTGDGLDLARPGVSDLPTGPGFARLFVDRVRVGA
ncbi:ABC transporter substrate-binding protein [Umezawaea beigongshangensis]|uniref:ABC transporter substrate-binding protein n=1 Tax=Umezawaea beigongshangensis TaxID=2780383 RepID=UPI0018F10E64|nr:ABC transporter substrate-binding protein [Umezawaea beigongshangensis]